MPETPFPFNRDETAHWYASRHLRTDPGITSIYSLKRDASEREIRLLAVNEWMAVRDDDPLEPIDFGVDVGEEAAHKLLVIDVTPSQWDEIRSNQTPLPPGWTLEGATLITRASV